MIWIALILLALGLFLYFRFIQLFALIGVALAGIYAVWILGTDLFGSDAWRPVNALFDLLLGMIAFITAYGIYTGEIDLG
jgi:hypothetical protein